MSAYETGRPGVSRRTALMMGASALAGVAVMASGVRMAKAAEQVLKIAHPVFDMDWSPLRGGGAHQRQTSLWWASPMYFDADNQIHPYVFTAWTPSEDLKVWTFAIDPKAVFSDGSKITAADVKGSFELAAMPSTKHQRVNQVLAGVVGYDEVTAGSAKEMPGIVADGEETVVITLTQPDPIFFMRLANHLVPIVKPSEARDENGEEVIDWWSPDLGGVSSGPFKLVELDLDGGRLAFEPNENFFGPKPKLARIEIQTVEDAVTATALLKKGEFAAHTELVTSTIAQDLGPDFAKGPIIPTSQHFWLDSSKKPMDDPKVRQALIMAVDRDGLMKASFPDGPHVKADQILNSVPGVDESFEPYPFDPEAAWKLLAESSYGGPERLPKLMMVGISSPAIEAAAQYIAEQWRQNLGITAVEMKPQQDGYSGPDQANVQIFRDDVGTRVPDAVTYLWGAIYSGSSNAKNKLGGYRNEEIDALLIEASAKAADDPERIALAQKAQRLFREDWNFIPWYDQAMSRWANANVKGMDKNLDWQVVEPWNIELV
ncbi:ABC transporter substrate-binding protein [Methylobrevis pamukkalensis]|uniref:Periplasmic oligopeptide-binding protein n=1 Tax=Methylobrevis pamukkalensis TaxID=1439726 RepID=A0A1E3H3W7_9HYPH|nr:ABC transporter substrate-binding protein [Methylobrevis pamukkalensis]ODN71023.1 Periplasmic oligopeptide-binding protein precursor [Methylobrevis pamukkalensis]